MMHVGFRVACGAWVAVVLVSQMCVLGFKGKQNAGSGTPGEAFARLWNSFGSPVNSKDHTWVPDMIFDRVWGCLGVSLGGIWAAAGSLPIWEFMLQAGCCTSCFCSVCAIRSVLMCFICLCVSCLVVLRLVPSS